jgi:anti-anti-sigma factor
MSTNPTPASVSGLQFHTYTWEDATVVQCSGQLTIGHTDGLKAHVRSQIPTANRIILDLKGIGRVDSAGLGTLVGLYISAKKANCPLVLTNYNPSVRKLLGLSNLLSVFEACAQSGMRFP